MILMQAFCWDCPQAEEKEGEWWNHLQTRIPGLADVGITTLWLPPSSKSSHVDSMGYAPYDYFDQGEFDQKGGVKTWFGSTAELRALIRTAHDHGMTVVADTVLNHCDIGDAREHNPITGNELMTKFTPKSGKFPRDWTYFTRANTLLKMPAHSTGTWKGTISRTSVTTIPTLIWKSWSSSGT